MHAKCSPCFPSRSSLESWRNDCRYLSPKVSDLPLLPCAECRFATLKSVDLWIRIESLIRIHIRSSVGPIRKNRNRILKRIFGDSEMDRVVTAVVAVFQEYRRMPLCMKETCLVFQFHRSGRAERLDSRPPFFGIVLGLGC
jgi:hypothetical protein